MRTTLSEKAAALRARIRSSPPVQTLLRLDGLCQRRAFVFGIAAVLLYRVMLDVLYVLLLSNCYQTSKMDDFFIDLTPLRYLSSYFAVLLASPFLSELLRRKEASSRLLTLISLCYFLPLTCYYGCRGADVRFFITALLYWALLLFWQFRLPHFHLKPPSVRHSGFPAALVTLIFCAAVLYVSGRYTHFRLTFDIYGVYDIRTEAEQYALPGVLSYLLGMAPIALAILLIYWLERKKYLVSAGIVAVYLFLFSIAGNKSTFLFLILLLAGYVLYREWMFRYLPAELGAVAGLAVLWLCLSRTENLLGDLFFRRMMFVPVHLSQSYYRFFSENPLNLSRDGILHWFSFSPVYSTSIPRLIGEYLDAPMMNANNGLLGDLFANLPIPLGLLLLPLILVICFRILDLFSHGISAKLLVPLCIYYMVGFQDAVWSTVLLTNGYLLACLLLYVFPRKEAPDELPE